ncbi:MAG: hypothetical protein IJQ60_02705 [Prevotella sp.]|nr:hypothetical protein [Prevotella sp.]
MKQIHSIFTKALLVALLTITVQTAWAEKVNVVLSVDNDFAEGTAGHYYVNMPPANDQYYWLTLTEADIAAGKGTFKVYDDGGKNGNYSDDKQVYLILTAPTGYVCQLSGSITTETGDCLTVFDGSSTSKLLNSVSSTSDGTETAITTVVSSGNIMRLYFVSNGSKNYAGLDLTVTLINPNAEHNITINNATGGSIASNKSTAKFNDVVTLTASPESGYVLNDLNIVDGNSNTVTVTGGWYTNNAATFTMPASNVTVAPVFTTDLTSLYINMPRTGTVNATIPAGVTSFKVYDDGGASGNYSYNCDGTLVLIAPTGYLLQLSGNITTDKQHEYLNVYDGNTTSATKLLGPVSSPSNGTAIDITTVTSTANYMTLCFKSDGALNYAGLDLTVTVSVSNVKHSINVNTAEGGSVAASVGGSPAETAYVNDVVKLTASPSNGSLLSDLSVKDANNNAVAVSDMLWYTGNTTATFTMPSSAVTVTPTFTNTLTADGGLYVNMPATGDKTATIPAGVTSFKVYDDGGKNGNYSDKCDGTLVLTAPTGYRLQLSGNIKTERFHDKLTVYDGSTTSGTKLLDAVSSTEGYIQTAITTVTSTGNSMTLCFKSDDGVNHAGLDLTVFASNMEYNINVNTAEGGSVATTVGGANASAAKLNDVVTLTATPSEGYVLSGISVTDASSNAVDIDWSIWTNTATFTMPGSAVTVTPTFTNAKTAADGLNITMIKTGEQTATIPAGVQSFHVDYDYSIKSSGSSKLTITAPEGYLLQLSGTATMTGFDHAYFYVYDGDDVVNDPTLINSSSSGNYTGVVSTGNVMTIYCWTIYNQGKTWDLDLTVNVVTANNYNDVVISNSIANGQVVSDKNTANVNETVTLTATPAEGYVLQSISVTDGNGAISLTPSATDATWGDASYYTANEFTFKMRSSDATVNATFMAKTDFYVNMPKTDQRDFTIPDGTASFKVYDNSGKNGSYSNNNNGKLLLTAPEGYVMNVSGYVKLYYTSEDADYLDIYDGNSTSATSLGRFKDKSGNNNTFTQTPVTATSSTNQMLLHFVTDNSGYVDVGGGVYLTVTLAPKEYTITYNGVEEATFATANPTTYTIESAAITLNNPTREGYAFAGWTGTGLDAATTTVTIAQGSTGDRSYTATWKRPLTNADITVTAIEDQVWTGSAIEPAVAVTDGTTDITDQCTIVYSDNTATGTATVTITAKAASATYCGETSTTFNILPKTVTVKNNQNEDVPAATGDATITQDENGTTLTLITPTGTDAPQTVNIPQAVEVDHVNIQRTYVSGKASTVYLPFSIEVSKLSGGTFHTFTNVDQTTSPWTVNYSVALAQTATLEANTPYLFMPDGTNEGKIVLNNSSDKVSVCTANPHTTTQGQWEFIGTYEPIVWASEHTDLGKVYGFAAVDKEVSGKNITAGQFVKAAAGASIAPMRAYLKYTPVQAAPARGMNRGASAEDLPATMRVVIAGANGETTEVGTISIEQNSGDWYTIDGRKLSGKPMKKGLYIHNGQKTVIK